MSTKIYDGGINSSLLQSSKRRKKNELYYSNGQNKVFSPFLISKSKAEIYTIYCNNCDREYVAVPRDVNIEESVNALPVDLSVQEYVPRWEKTTILNEIPRKVYIDEETVVPVTHKQIIDEYVEVPVKAGTKKIFVPKVEVEERKIEITKPRIKWIEKEKIIPQIREVVRYQESADNVEKVYRYIPDSPNIIEMLEEEEENANPKFEDVDNVEVNMVNVNKHWNNSSAALTIDVPVPFIVPKPICYTIDVPIIKFNDTFVPIPIRRHVTPKLTFTTDIFSVPCIREKPILIIEDKILPVPVNVHFSIKEKDITINPIDPSLLAQNDVHAMWMRVAADQLDVYKSEHFGKLPSGTRVSEDQKVPSKETDWDVVLNAEHQSTDEIKDELELGPLPIDTKNPLMMTWLQSQWMNLPTTETHTLYTPEFFRAHYAALNQKVDPTAKAIFLTKDQAQKLGPNDAHQLPHPWSSINAIKRAANKEAEMLYEVNKNETTVN